ncbi:AAA family ATPase [Mycobacterium numidiamassiliense]|uniref:AAA family ATPase n=1 Tax=Mycobacterium numidiamassiliense TaxID=1841861 RepID=A0A2U3PDU4_9MYCO|nr:MobF family relaxase [Mycobacterium numidiamassiliense]SPM41921.1 AAA family ATPase [Mycobacterium numidiamassiliense]
MLTCSPLKLWSIDYYNRTAREAGQAAKDAVAANGGLGEYYSEHDTRAPVWLVAGDARSAAALVGLSDEQRAGGLADLDVVQRWLDGGIAPNGCCGRRFAESDNHGIDMTFCAPKSVSLLRAFGDDVVQKAVLDAHNSGVREAMEYVHQHAGYTRVHNNRTGRKDLQRLPGVVAAAYQHETSRAGDPHLHTHVIVPNKQPRTDGKLGAVDTDSLWHESKAGGVIYQATLRRALAQSLGAEWSLIDPHTGMAELVGIDPEVIKAHSRRSTQLREWAEGNLILIDGPTQGQLAIAQKATRPRKPEGMSWAELRQQWRADPRGYRLDIDAQRRARTQRRAATVTFDRRRIADIAAGIDKAAFTRADLVEIIGAQLPVEVDGDDRSPREQIEAAVDEIAMRVSAPRQAHHREGHERYTIDLILAEEIELLGLVDQRDDRADLRVTQADTEGLSANQNRVVTAMAGSPWLVQPLAAPAGAGKTHCLKALRRAAHRAGRTVVVVAPHGRAVDVAINDCAGDAGYTVDKVLIELREGRLALTPRTVIVVDEAGLVGNNQLRDLLTFTTMAGTKVLLVGDAYQLAPVRKRGGMFEQLCADLPWSQRLSEVWRMRDPEERVASQALRNGGPRPLRRALEWYRRHDRLRCGDPVTIANDALQAYRADIAAGKDALLIPDSWELCDALNKQIHADRVADDAETVTGARDHQIGVGDIVVTRGNDARINVWAARDHRGRLDTTKPGPQVRNGQRWVVEAIDTREQRPRIAARRLGDNAVTVFGADYLRAHVQHGYAVTLQSAQGVTADTSYPIVRATTDRNTLYVGLTRGRDLNRVHVYERVAGEGDHEHADPTPGVHQTRRGDSHQAVALVRAIACRDNRPQTVHQVAAQTDFHQLPDRVARAVAQQARARARRLAAQRVWIDQLVAERAQQNRWIQQYLADTRSDDRDNGHDLGL